MSAKGKISAKIILTETANSYLFQSYFPWHHEMSCTVGGKKKVLLNQPNRYSAHLVLHISVQSAHCVQCIMYLASIHVHV